MMHQAKSKQALLDSQIFFRAACIRDSGFSHFQPQTVKQTISVRPDKS
jgi:hypothetical protein